MTEPTTCSLTNEIGEFEEDLRELQKDWGRQRQKAAPGPIKTKCRAIANKLEQARQLVTQAREMAVEL